MKKTPTSTPKNRTSKPAQPLPLSVDKLRSVRGGESHGAKRLPTRHYAAW